MEQPALTCIGFGSTEHESCLWIRIDRPSHKGVCNDCAELVKAWDQGARDSSAPTLRRRPSFIHDTIADTIPLD